MVGGQDHIQVPTVQESTTPSTNSLMHPFKPGILLASKAAYAGLSLPYASLHENTKKSKRTSPTKMMERMHSIFIVPCFLSFFFWGGKNIELENTEKNIPPTQPKKNGIFLDSPGFWALKSIMVTRTLGTGSSKTFWTLENRGEKTTQENGEKWDFLASNDGHEKQIRCSH